MSEDALRDAINKILSDPQFIVRVNNSVIMGKHGGLNRAHVLPASAQNIIERTTFSYSDLQSYFAQANRRVQELREA